MRPFAGRVTGLIIFPVSVAFLLYALGLYHWRRHKIRRKAEGSYDDRWGPTVLVVFLVGALVANAVLTVSNLGPLAAPSVPASPTLRERKGHCHRVVGPSALGPSSSASGLLVDAGGVGSMTTAFLSSPYMLQKVLVNESRGTTGGSPRTVSSVPLADMDAEAITRHPAQPLDIVDVGVEYPGAAAPYSSLGSPGTPIRPLTAHTRPQRT